MGVSFVSIFLIHNRHSLNVYVERINSDMWHKYNFFRPNNFWKPFENNILFLHVRVII